MKQIIPNDIYQGLPCSAVAVGCAMRIDHVGDLRRVMPKGLHDDGYLSLDGMNRLVRANAKVWRKDYFKRGFRPQLKEVCEKYKGKAVVCVLGHFLYIENGDYYSFFDNANDRVVCIWYIEGGNGIS